jgi:hypothetical protein
MHGIIELSTVSRLARSAFGFGVSEYMRSLVRVCLLG